MSWTTPVDHTASVVSVNEWNAQMGATGNLAYLKSVQDTANGNISTLQSNVSSLQSSRTTDEGNISTLQSAVSSLQSSRTTDENNIGTLQSDVTSLKGSRTTDEGNISTLQGQVLVPIKAQKDGGTILGGRNKTNFISGANVTLTVADNAGSDRIDVTIAAAGAVTPTQSQGSGVISVVSSSSQNVMGAWAEAIASSSFAAVQIVFMALGQTSVATLWNVGVGSAGNEVIKIAGILVGTGSPTVHLSVPYSIAQSSRIALQVADIGAASQVTCSAAVTILG